MNAAKLASERIEFPDNHIEADNRLSWLLGRLDMRYGDEAYYVWLKRDDRQVSESYSKRWGGGHLIMEGYCRSVLQFPESSNINRVEVASDYVGTVDANIQLFLKDKTNGMIFRLENARADFERFWNWIGAEGNLSKALNEWERTYNATASEKRSNLFQRGTRKVVRILRKLPLFVRKA